MHMGSIGCNVVVPSACASVARQSCRLPIWARRICDRRTLQPDQLCSLAPTRRSAHQVVAMASGSSTAGSAGLAEGLQKAFSDRWVPWERVPPVRSMWCGSATLQAQLHCRWEQLRIHVVLPAGVSAATRSASWATCIWSPARWRCMMRRGASSHSSSEATAPASCSSGIWAATPAGQDPGGARRMCIMLRQRMRNIMHNRHSSGAADVWWLPADHQSPFGRVSDMAQGVPQVCGAVPGGLWRVQGPGHWQPRPGGRRLWHRWGQPGGLAPGAFWRPAFRPAILWSSLILVKQFKSRQLKHICRLCTDHWAAALLCSRAGWHRVCWVVYSAVSLQQIQVCSVGGHAADTLFSKSCSMHCTLDQALWDEPWNAAMALQRARSIHRWGAAVMVWGHPAALRQPASCRVHSRALCWLQLSPAFVSVLPYSCCTLCCLHSLPWRCRHRRWALVYKLCRRCGFLAGQ